MDHCTTARSPCLGLSVKLLSGASHHLVGAGDVFLRSARHVHASLLVFSYREVHLNKKRFQFEQNGQQAASQILCRQRTDTIHNYPFTTRYTLQFPCTLLLKIQRNRFGSFEFGMGTNVQLSNGTNNHLNKQRFQFEQKRATTTTTTTSSILNPMSSANRHNLQLTP